MKNEFDFSNYSPQGPRIPSKKRILQFRDESSGGVLVEFFLLKAKMYSIFTNG